MSTQQTNQEINKDNINETSKKETFFIIGISFIFIFCSLFFQDFSKDHYSDYIVFAYSVILVSFVIVHTLDESLIGNYLNKNIKMITTIRGRGIILLCVSLLYINKKNIVRMIAAIVLMLLSLYLILNEFLCGKRKMSILNGKEKETNEKKDENNNQEVKEQQKTEEEVAKEKANPYNIPDDF